MKRLVLSSLVFSFLLLGCVSQQQATASPSPTASLFPSVASTVVSPTIKGDVLNNAQNLNNGQKVENGDSVAVDYLGSLDDGTVFDTSIKEEAAKAKLPPRPSYEPLEFTVGAGQMIAGFDNAVVNMKQGEEKTVRLAPSDAYGERDEELVVSYSIENIPAEATVGVTVYTASGRPGKILSINSTHATIDFNHELAGKALNFKITIRKITRP